MLRVDPAPAAAEARRGALLVEPFEDFLHGQHGISARGRRAPAATFWRGRYPGRKSAARLCPLPASQRGVLRRRGEDGGTRYGARALGRPDQRAGRAPRASVARTPDERGTRAPLRRAR